MKKEKFEARCNELNEMGLKFSAEYGGSYVWFDINFPWIDIQCMDDAQWEKAIAGSKQRKIEIDEKLVSTVENDLQNNTLPFLQQGEKPKHLQVTDKYIMYDDRFDRSVTCSFNDGQIWLDHFLIPKTFDFQSIVKLCEVNNV